MKELLEKLIITYNKTHKGQLLIKNDIVFHADIAGFAFPLDYFEDDVKTVFERMTKLIDIYQAIDKSKWKNIFIYRDNVTVYTGWNEIKLYPLDKNTVQVKHYYKYSLKQTLTRSFDELDKLIKIAILP